MTRREAENEMRVVGRSWWMSGVEFDIRKNGCQFSRIDYRMLMDVCVLLRMKRVSVPWLIISKSV